MQSGTKKKLLAHVGKLMREGRDYEAQYRQTYANRDPDIGPLLLSYSTWAARIRNFLRMLGPEFATPYERTVSLDYQNHYEMNGVLAAIWHDLEDDALISAEQLIRGEVFGSLLEQAEHLLENGFHLAAGVLGRAVLEEHLRKWCNRAGCLPQKQKPTMADFKSELYAKNHMSKVEMLHVEAMAAVGNDAAHNLPTLARNDVERMVRDVRDFTAQHPV